MAHSSAISQSVNLACVWISRLATASLCALWITARGGVVLGIFPALAALMALSRRWLAGEPQGATWSTLRDLARRDFGPANVAGLATLAPLAGAALAVELAQGPKAAHLVIVALGLCVLPIAMALAAWVALPVRQMAMAPWLVFLSAPHRGVLAALCLTAAAGLGLIHPLLALYFAPSLAALTAAQALVALPANPLISLADTSPAPLSQRIRP